MPSPSSPTPPRRRLRLRWLERAVRPLLGRRVYAVAALTLKATFRYRLIQVLLLLLAAAVVGLPAIIKHDGTAQGFTQILLTYTLGSVTVLLAFANLWLGCGTLSRDIEECQIQVVVTKPIDRWQVWLGKWLGILALNALLLSLAGLTLYSLLQWRASRLPEAVRQELQQKILVARGSVREPIPQAEIDQEVQALLQERLKDLSIAAMDRMFVRTQIVEQVKSQFQIIPPGMVRRWKLDFGRHANAVANQPLTLRTKFYAANRNPSGTYLGVWEIGPPEGRRFQIEAPSVAPETFLEFPIRPGLLEPDGTLTIDFQNHNPVALLFPFEEGLEVLYPEGAFGLNFMRALSIIFCWLALLAAIGLTAGSFLSFPVAAFCAVGLLIVSSSTGTLRQIIDEGGITQVNPNTGKIETPAILDSVSIFLAKSLLRTINVVRDFSPIDSLSSGRSVTWGQVARATSQIILLMGGLFAAVGIWLFNRRELATAQGSS